MNDLGTGYNPALWTTFFSAETAASAALTGLLFVSISINQRMILKVPQLIARAGSALATLGTVLLISTLCLVPAATRQALGWNVLVLGAVSWIATTLLQRAAMKNYSYIGPRQRLSNVLLKQASGLPFVFCGLTLLIGRGGGLNWLVAGTLISFTSALIDSWVLLIEIQR